MTQSIKISVLALLFSLQFIQAQDIQKYKIHSHNDYEQNIPFWSAYANGLNSIEADIFLKDNNLYVSHTEADTKKERTLEKLYLDPLQQVMTLQLGNQQPIQLLIDIKTESVATLKKLINVLENYPKVINNKNFSIVISGNRPEVKTYTQYPNYIQFDYQSLVSIPEKEQWDKVALISKSFSEFSSWNGKGRLTAEDYKKVSEAIKKAHSYGKPFRFWGCPDSKTAWKTFKDLGVDFINTDMPYESSRYLNTLDSRVFYNTIDSPVYTPTYLSDKKNSPIQNVILLIGDGNGLAQISSAVLANGGQLTLTQLKSIGFLKTQSSDDFTTDSAAAGTALATGQKTYNRAIGVDSLGKPTENIMEVLTKKGFSTGLITTDHITGATPASFYAHQKERDLTAAIANDLMNSKLSLFMGGGSTDFAADFSKTDFSILNSIADVAKSNKNQVGLFFSENKVPSVLKGRGNLLAEATKNGLEFLNAKNKPFFLMVEGAQIDSYGHANNVPGIVSEGIDFDRAITEAIKFADKTGNTLVIVTADHETSGFTLPQGNLKEKMIEGDFTTYDHTGIMVPIFTYGPQSDIFSGVYENNEVFHKIKQVLKLQ
ncbi:alkaline phosphatase [Flavobacterium sp. LB2P84]|uniref:alkaline phosphatase n=1 Tax=Flavobacterium yafengii TaxID=3041253 RepID=UPI0024A90DC7|nr:alkaline phosphatase [Flavobacterium yafengii]MDI6033004.1 alkaline phosphatase [Flavobacterium yafengii]